MKVGVDLDSQEIFIQISSGGVSTTTGMNPASARAIAAQLKASAKVIEDMEATENDEDDEDFDDHHR